jgi:hypothetical protein
LYFFAITLLSNEHALASTTRIDLVTDIPQPVGYQPPIFVFRVGRDDHCATHFFPLKKMRPQNQSMCKKSCRRNEVKRMYVCMYLCVYLCMYECFIRVYVYLFVSCRPIITQGTSVRAGFERQPRVGFMSLHFAQDALELFLTTFLLQKNIYLQQL